MVKGSPGVAKYTGNLMQDPIPFELLEEIFSRYLFRYEEGWPQISSYSVQMPAIIWSA
jgi:hypothetical protein